MPGLKPFQFSQSSLQDFDTCPRRFKLRYVQRLSWPAIESEPVRKAERLAQLGADFHRLVHQHLLGLDEALLTDSLIEAEPELRTWWQRYLSHRPAMLAEAEIHPELPLSTPLAGHRLLARFDLLARMSGSEKRFLVIDWKTAQRKAGRDTLARRIQTRVYPYVLATAGAAFNDGQAIDPAAITMIYWYPQAPEQPEAFVYSNGLFERDRQYLIELVARIEAAMETDDFPLVTDSKPCLYCVYRSFCDRGEKAGPVLEQEEDPQELLDVTSLDWDQIAEIQF